MKLVIVITCCEVVKRWLSKYGTLAEIHYLAVHFVDKIPLILKGDFGTKDCLGKGKMEKDLLHRLFPGVFLLELGLSALKLDPLAVSLISININI